MSMVQIQMYILTNPCCFANFETWHKYMLDLDHISIIQIIIDIEEHQPLGNVAEKKIRKKFSDLLNWGGGLSKGSKKLY